MTALPLAGIRVVDLTRILSGPFCSMILGDLGAEIVKVETPGEGDPVRGQGVIKDGLSWYFAGYNRNKKSITVNLRALEGREVLAKLIAKSDVVVENFRPGVMDDMGFSDARLKELNPHIVHGSITGFGSSGPYRDRPSFDFIAQAMTGFMSLNGGPNDPPMRAGPPVSDLIAGLYAALGIVAGLVRREKTGDGGSASVSLNGGLISFLSFLGLNYLANGALPQRTGNDHGIASPYGLFRTRDGEIAIAPSNDSFYLKLIDAVGAPQLRDRPEFKTNDLRVKNRAAINVAVEERTLTQTSDHWIKVLNKAGVPCSSVMNLQEALSDPHNIHQKAVVTVPHPGHGDVSMLGSPMTVDGEHLPVRLPAPELGEHTREVLESIGLSLPEIDALKVKGVI